MAKPIKETPILYGEDARMFELRMMNPPKFSKEKREKMFRDYEMLRRCGTNCIF